MLNTFQWGLKSILIIQARELDKNNYTSGFFQILK